MTTKELLTEARKLPPGKRVRLANRILATADEDDDGVLLPWQKAELERRIEEDLRHPERALTWEEVERRLDRRLKRKPCPSR